MTQEAFENLVNLYLDGEIESDDCCRLMEEVERNPQRRKEFDDHCRLHSAVQLALFSRSVSQKSATAVPAAKPGVQIDQLQRSKAIMAVVQTAKRRQRRRHNWMRANQLTAIAACFSLLCALVLTGSWDRLPKDASQFLGTAPESEVATAVAGASNQANSRSVLISFETAPDAIFGQQPTVPAARLNEINAAAQSEFRLLAGGEWLTFEPNGAGLAVGQVVFTGPLTADDGEPFDAILRELAPVDVAPLRAVPAPMSVRSGFTIDLSGLASESR
ncbi:MAG: hypothetical protein ACFB20_08015 [Opitutales bacterium]